MALTLTALVAVLEFWGGARSHSLALSTDAVHVCMDLFALGIALGGTFGAQRPANRRKTFGYGRIEMLGALVNGALLLGATIFIIYQAVQRLRAPQLPHAELMTLVAAAGLAINLIVGLLLLRDGRLNLNVRAALFHVGGDALGAAAVVIGGFLIYFFQIGWLDPVLSLLVAAIIIIGVVGVLREATDVLLESAPRGVDTEVVLHTLRELPGVVDIHDLHIWTIGSRNSALSAHALLDDRRISEATAVLRLIEGVLRDSYAINHVTIQFECETCEPDARVICTQRR
ncbi:MAG: cation diffusion facilitator family transporter [Candidatus Baltobacteraceae bacterium]